MLHIFCNGYTRILQAAVPKVSAILDGCCTCFIWVLHMFHTYVASVSSGCCVCFTHMLQVFYLDVAYVFAMATHVFSWSFRRMLQVFQLFWTYVANVFSGYCKSRYGVTYVVERPICNSRLLQLLGVDGERAAGVRNHAGRKSRRSSAVHKEGTGHRAARASP